MNALATEKTTKRAAGPAVTDRKLALERAVARVMLGAPPAAVAADLGCDAATLMRYVKIRRRELRRALRADEPAAVAPAEPAAPRVVPGSIRQLRERQFLADRPVEPENSALVDAAYAASEFDYSGRRVRAATTH